VNTSYLSEKQVDQLLAPINPARVEDLRGMSYVAQHDIRAHMNRIFGFGRWSTQVISTDLIFDEEVTTSAGRTAWKAAYRVVVRVEIHAPDGTVLATYEDAHASGNAPQPDRAEAHALALTSAVSTAFKRACTNLGDQFGLSLYEGGQKTAFVKGLIDRDSLFPRSDSEPSEPESAQADSAVTAVSEPRVSEEVLSFVEALTSIDEMGLEASERILKVAALKAGAPQGLLDYMTPSGVTVGIIADRVAAGRK
jgi:recombination DNA repair RAD52 pathway protein